jgi:hydrophobic/amphiphilic exporter-1 (mainly G- bacteria), HAE1 family
VAGGMLLSTFLNIIFIPVLYVVIETLRERVTGAPPVAGHADA